MRPPRLRRSVEWTVVAAVALFGLSLRLLGIRLGLPFQHHWDEWWVADSAAKMLRNGNDMPASFQYGAPLSRLTEGGFWLLCRLRGRPPTVSVDDEYVTLYLVGRTMTAVISASGTVAIYLAARVSERGVRHASWVALASALLYAAAYELVIHSRYAVTDACLVGLTCWTLAAASAYVATRRAVWGAACLVAAGVTFAFKFPGIMTALIPLVALAVFASRPASGRGAIVSRVLLMAAVPTIVGCYVILNPHVLDRTQDAVNDIVGRYRQTRDGGVSPYYQRTPGLPHLASAAAAIGGAFLQRTRALAWLLSLVSCAGIAIGLKRRRAAVGLALLHALAVTLAVALPNRAFLLRNYLVTIPCLCLGFGLGVVALVEAIATWQSRWRATAVAAVVSVFVLAVVVLPLHDALSAESMKDDPRAAAVAWVSGDARTDRPVDVALTSTVLGKRALGHPYAGASKWLERPNLHFRSVDIEACPAPQDGPEYVVNASYQDPRQADPADPSVPQWLFRECPGYRQVAAFDPNPYEHDVRMTPNWWGRVSVTVLRKGGS